MNRPEFMQQDVHDLQLINWLAKKDYKKDKFCYRLKDVLLSNYAVPDGFDLQFFTRADWSEYAYGEVYSWHEHLLARYKIGEIVFHRPTGEYSYRDRYDRHKQSENFEEYKAKCRGFFEGLKETPENFDKTEAVRALRRTVHKFKSVLRQAIKKPERTEFWFFKERGWWGSFDGYTVRIPPSVTVCSGCGARFTALLSRYDVQHIEREKLTEFLFVTCDTDLHDDPQCPEQIKWFLYQRDPYGSPKAWVAERKQAACWLQETFPRFVKWKQMQEGSMPKQLELIAEAEALV